MKATVILDKNGKVVGSVLGNISVPPIDLSREPVNAAGLAGTDYSRYATPSFSSGLVKNDDYNYLEVEVSDDFAKLEATELHQHFSKLLKKK